MPRPTPVSAPDAALFAQGAVARALERRAQRQEDALAPPGADTGLMAWIPRLIPSFQAPRHLAPLIECLDAVPTGPQRLVISTPVRHGKTESLTLGIASLLQHDPTLSIGYVSYSSAIAHSKSRIARSYARRAGVELAQDAQSLGEWRTTDGGGVLAAGIGAGWTGFGVQCLAAGTQIETEIGPLEIETLIRLDSWPRVLGYDHTTGHTRWCRVLAARESDADAIVLIRTRTGRTLRCTPEHPVYTESHGYRSAALLRPGDRLTAGRVQDQHPLPAVRAAETVVRPHLPRLLGFTPRDGLRAALRRVLSTVRAAALPIRENGSEGHREALLLQSMPAGGNGRTQSHAIRAAPLPDVRTADAQADRLLLFRPVPEGRSPHDWTQAGNRHTHPDYLSHLPHHISTAQFAHQILQSGLRLARALQAHDRNGKLALQDRHQLRPLVHAHAPADFRAGWESLRHVRGEGDDSALHAQGHPGPAIQPTGSPHQSPTAGQSTAEPRAAVLELPRHPPQVEHDAVSVVVPLRSQGERVYDLQVEGTSNLFANGILVHNCLVVDDPLRNRAEAESSQVREDVWRSFNADLYTRLEPGASVIVCMARWHEDDLAGRLSEQGWPTVTLPAIDERGAVLWPERWPKQTLLETREQVGEYDWWSLYQGSPRPRGGALFRGTTLYDAAPSAGYRLAIATDLAYTAKTRADWSVAILGAEKDRQVYILDVQRRQSTAADFGLVLKSMQDRTGAMITTRIAGPEIGTIDMLRERYGLRIATIPALADKFVTAQPAAAAWNGGSILVPHDAPWLSAFLRVVGEFSGVGDAHDDDVDALSTLYSVLGGRRGSFVG